MLAGALHTNRTLHKFLLNNNPLGKYGGRAMLGTWNFMEMEREIRMSGCSFDLLDPDSTSFDPSKPGGKYCLKVGDPLRGAYDKYVAHELCRMATVRNGHFFEHIEHISEKDNTLPNSPDKSMNILNNNQPNNMKNLNYSTVPPTQSYYKPIKSNDFSSF